MTIRRDFFITLAAAMAVIVDNYDLIGCESFMSRALEIWDIKL